MLPRIRPAVGEQLVARLGKRAGELLRRVEQEPVVLVVRRPQERDDLQVLVLVDGAVQELQLVARLAFEVQDLLGAIVDVDERLALVVLRDELAGPRRDPEPEHARAGIRRREAHAHRRRLAVDRQLHLLRPDDAAFVLDVERHRLARVAGLRDERVDHQRRALERARRRRHPIDLDVLRQRFTAEPDREHRDVRRLHRQQRVRELGIGRVRAVGHDDESRKRQTGELLPRTVERRPYLGLRSAEAELGRRRQALGRRREPERPQHEPVRQRLEHVSVRPPPDRPENAKCCLTKALRGWPLTSAICMLRESSTSTPRKFCCGTAALTTSTGRKRQKRTRSSVASRMPASTAR